MLRRGIHSFAWYWLLGLVGVALFRDLLANGRPLYCRVGQQTYYPGLRALWADPAQPYGIRLLDSLNQADAWKTFPYDAAVFAPIPFSPGEWAARPACNQCVPGTVHPQHRARFRHWLGTDAQGRDVAAGMVSGTRIALITGSLAMSCALGLGLLLGSAAGFWGDHRLRVARGTSWVWVSGGLLWLFYIAYTPLLAEVGYGPFVVGTVAFFALLRFLGKWLSTHVSFLSRTIALPMDMLVMRAAEVFNAVPRLVILVAVAALVQHQSVWLLIALIGLLSWTGIARLVRAELLRIRGLAYVEAAHGLGFSDVRVWWRHALPNALPTIYVAVATGTGVAIQLEAGLSILGFGGQDFKGKSWGSLMEGIRAYPADWWVALPPALAIAFTVMALNEWGNRAAAHPENA